MAAGVVDLYVEQGAAFSRAFQLKNSDNSNFNLTGYTGHAQIRSNTQSDQITANITVSFDADRTTGIVYLSMDRATTKAIPTKGKTYAQTTPYTWDLYLVDGFGTPTRVLNGAVAVSPDSTDW